MAERPLYTLYKNLKAQNYDVPDDYNKFESALTRDGKGGADNRHAIYENLKAQNFDVPSTYERFYSALFEPRSRTSSRAKGGSVPMSAADRARFSAGAAVISASAQQTMNNAGRYNRLKQRKQKQQKDFGRVNLGTHQTPYGGDANNVVKDDFAYNPETGKTGAYVTSDNENVYSLPEAEQMQAILDKQNDAYQVAVDTGEIPSAFDVRDKNGNYDLQENIGKNGTYLTEEGAQKQFDKKLADAYARKKEIEALIAEDNRQHGNPLLSYGASIGASNGRTAEQSDYRNKLATSLSLVTEQIGALEAVKQYPTSSWVEDALKALDNTAFTAKTWDFGLTDFAIMGQMERIKTKMDNNIPLSGSDKMLLKSKLGADAATALEDEKMGNVYRWTKIAGQSLPFMADFFLTGGYGGITKGISRGALKFAAKRGMGKVSAAILKNTGIVAGDVIGSYAMAGTEQALKTGADIMQRHLGNLYQDEKGDYKFGTFDENGNLLHEGGESIGTALYKGMTSAMVENYTEKLFGHNYGIKKGAVNFMEKHGMNASAEFFKNIGKSGWYTNSKKWMEKFGINGFAEEVMEEEIGIPLHALLDGEGKVSDLLDAKQQLDIIGGMAISVGSMYAMGAGSRPAKGIYNRAQYYRFRNKVNVADIDAQNLMGDNWADIKDKIDNATNEQMGSVLADILRKRDTMTKEQINAAVNYGVNLMKMRGYNIAKTAEMNAKEITNEPTTPEEQHQSDIDNAYSEGHDADDADKHDIQIQQEDQMKTLAAALGISEQQLSAMSDEELESLTGQDDKLDQAIYDYQLSYARYKGVVDDAQDKVDLAAHQAEQRVDMYTDQSRGSVRNATIKASGGLEDYGVYIISGNIATHDDGSIDVSNSDDMILYFDPTTNSVEHADAFMFAELGEELPADDVKAQAVYDAKENAIKKVAGIIDGTVEVGSQFNVTDTDGTEHTYEVLADYGDGTAAISIDGNVVENPYSLADLQQMKDLEDQKRLEAAKAEREQMEKERAAQQTQETQPSFDFNQILNDNGNVVLADVLGKDGNTKYPNSQLFLIRDSGAKAKVVELKSDGTLVPHAVNKKDVRTATTMTLDEYKQAFADSSMIEDNSGEESDEDSQLANLGLPKGSEIWMSGDGFGRPKENTLSKVVGIDEQGSIVLEDKDGKKWSASFDYINNHREFPPLDENANIVNEENNQSESNAEENTPAPEQTPAITLEDGTIVPMLEDGNPDFSKLTAEQTAELYDSQFGEDADSIVSGYVSDAKKALDKASNMTVKGKTFVEQKAAKDAKEKAIADAQAAYDSAIAIRDAYNERQLAKVEDTAEGRKELIEKARRKFARLKSAVKDDAEAVSQLYRDTIGSLLHRLYDGTGIDVTDTTPLTAEEYVASNLGAHSLNYEGTETSKGVKQETGLSREDFAKTQLLAADGKGTTIDALVHSLWENRPSNLESLDTQDIRNALIGVLNSGFKASEARNFVENIRIAQAENILEEQKRAQENAVYAEQHKAEQEAELGAKSDEKAEQEAKSEAKLDNESDNESNDLSNETDNEKINDNINDNINVPEDATEEAPLGAQRDESDLPFSAKENGKQQTTAERAADVEKNKVDDMKVVDNIVGEKTRKAFERLAKMMGANIQWQYSDKLGNGWIQETKDADGNVHRTIFITLDSSITEGAQFIFGHEMTHQIKNLNPAAYNELTQLVLDTYGSDAFDKAVDETMQRYSDAGFSGRARDYYAEEVVADSVGEMIRDLNLAHTLAMKMSHPLLAAIHEILQKIKLAFFGTEYSDVTKNIIRSIEQAYVKTAKGEVTNSETGEDVSFSLRQKPEPKKKGIGYKVFVLKDGKLYPPMVANPDGAATSVGVWLDADAAPIAGESKTGRPQVKQGGKGTQGGSGKLAYRPGWHLGVVPYAIQFNRKDADGNKTLFPKNFVFAEVEYAADVDYQEEARQEGINPSGKYQHSLAGLKHLPTDGYYMYRTNPNPETDPWVITGAMKVNRILTRAEQAELVKNAGREPQQIQEGDIVTDDVVNSINQEIADAPKFSLKVYHGSGADFTEFDFDHMGEGAGSQVFGWGGYVTSSKKIGKSYATLMDNDPSKAYYRIQRSNGTRFAKKYPTLESFLHGDKQIAMNDKFTEQEKIDFYNEMKKLAEPYHNLYEVDIPEDNGSNYLEWEKKPSDEVATKIIEGLYGLDAKTLDDMASKDIVFRTLLYDYIKNADKEQMIPNLVKTHALTRGTTYDNGNVEDDIRFVYNRLSRWMGSQKAASQFLSSLGFTGIKYPAGTIMGGAEENDTNYVIFKPEDMRITEHTKFSIKTYHGSQASFDKFDHSFMGSGEGAQAYGWGTYVSEVEGIAKAYAKQNANKHSRPQAYYKGEKLTNPTGIVIGVFNRMDVDDVSAKEAIARLIEEREKKMNATGYSTLRPRLQKEIDRLKELNPDDFEIRYPERNLYSVDIPDDTGRNYIGWDEPLGAAKIMRLPKVFKADGWEYKKVGQYDTYKIDGNENEVWLEPSLTTGKELYRDLTNALGSDKAASEFLSKAGFVGVKVIAQRNSGGNKEGNMNYVIFDENNAQITSHTKFSLRLKSAIEETETNPSDAQKESGNYKKGHIKFGGYDYTIENPKGSTRSGKDADGKEWKVIMHDTYGYIRGKFGKDGDHLDMFINDKADLDNWNGDVFVVDQVNPDGSFDEHKVMYGYDSMDDAKKSYLANYSDGWQGLGNITGASKDEFDKWLDTSNRKLKPFADYAKVKFSLKDIKPVGVGAFGNIYNQFRGNAKAAIEFLKKVRGGEAVGALHHKDIGDIDLVWGKEGTGHSDGYGLSKLVKYHPEVLDNLQEILNDMRVVSSSKNRVNLESETHKAGVRLTWDGERKSWLLTAFKKETSASDKRTDTAATSLEGDTALSQTEGSAAKIDNSSETAKENGEKFSLKDEKTLAGVHNISEEKLLKAIKQGGLANPSVAVIDSSRQDHKAYGGISLILPSDKIAKRTGKNAGTWQGDAYTPTYPEVEKQMSNKGAEKSSSDVLSVPKEMQHEVRNGIDRWLNGGDANSGLKYLFLHEKGVAPEPKMIQPKFSDEAYNELKFITAGDFNIYGIGKADAQKVLDMYIEAKFDGDKDLYEDKTKAWLERNKSIVDAGAKGGMRYAIAKENVELYDEYGFNYKGVQTFVRDVEYDHRKSGVDTNATLNEVEDYIKTNNLTDEFNTWLEGKEKEYGIKEVIFDGFTPSGNRRYVPNTLENVSKLMKKQGRNGATGAAVSFQNFAARLMPSYGTLKDIRSKKGLLTSDREKFDKFREKWSNVFFELGMKCQPYATGTFDDYGLARLSEAAMTSDPQAYLKKEYNVDFSDEDTKRLKEMVKAIKEEHPAMYFETKFERPVRFDEFSAAVVPTTTKKEVKEALKNAGVSIFEYDEKSDADRKRAFNEAINSSDNIRFSLAGERGAAAADKAEERTFRMDNLSVAKDMEKNKKKAKAIKAATGWERGADGKWRYEMPDVVLRDPKEWVNKKTLTLSDIVEKPNDLFKEYPELFDAYPELKDMKILKGRAKSGGVFYNNAITLNLGDIREAIKYDMDTHYKLANNSLKKTLVHEIQHYIQEQEGFAQGGNSEMIVDKNALDAIAKLRAEKDAVAKEFYAMSPEEQQRRKYEINNRYNDLTKQIERLEKSSRIGYDGYNRLSGEVEARNVSARLNMTPEERRKTLAESTEDVARKDQIFLGVGDVSFSLRDMADGKESGAADMAEDLKNLNTPDEVDDAIKTAIDDMPSGWQMANKKMIHIAQALGENRKAEIAGEEPKFSLKDGTLIKAGTYFSGGGLVEEGLKGIIDPVVAVEYDEKISGVYRNNFGQHIVTADVRDVDPKELVKQIDGEVEYFHASPVCKNYSQAKSNHAEVELDKETAASTAEFINAVKPKVVTIENVKGYKDSDAMKTITDALDANGYTWDADVYNAADYGGYTNRERLIVRAVRDGKLPEKPKKMAHKSGWYEAVADIIPTLTEKKNGVAPWMDIRLKADGIDWRNIDKPLYVMGSAYADGKVPHAFADELLPTLRTKSGDVIVMPDGKVYRAMGRVLARVSGVSDDYKMPFSENLSHTIIGNGIPTQLTEHVIAPLLHNTLRPTTPEDGNTKFSLRYDQFEHDLNQWKKDNNLPKDAKRPTIPQRNAGESAVDFLKRVDEYRKQMALWKTAPTYEQHLLSDDTALGEFNRELQRGSVLKRIAFQDSMLAIRKAQEAIMKEVGVDRLNMAEDAYTAENRSHGKGKNEFEEYNNEFLQPLRKAYHQMKKILGDSYDNVRIYMMAKHGLERDAQMAFKKSLDADFEDVAQRSAAYRAYKGDMNRITNDSDLEFGRVDFNTWRQRDNALRTKYSPSYMDYRYDENGIAYDYSGLSALFGGSDFEEAAHKLVRDIESNHVAEVQDLWNATNAATKKILRDGYKAGMMSKDTYLYVRDMYSHYIPLRGWDGTTADQVWDYVGGGKGAFNQTLKTAHGRTSIANDPIAYIENMAESGILLNNKNWVKQHLMLLAQNHPTSLLTLSKAWYVKSTDANGNEEWIPATPQITSQMNSNQVKAAIDAFEQKMEQMAQTGDATQQRDGLNIAYPQTHSEEREHEVRVMKDGEEYVIYVNGDPQLAQAMNNTRAHRVREIQSGKLDRAAAWLGRKMAAAYTSLSPLFIPSNYFRDLTMTLASTAIREDAKYNYLLRKNLATSWNLGFMLRDYQSGKLREKVSNGNATPKEQMFYDFMMNGGETGFVSSLDVEDLKKKFKNDLKDLDRWKTNPVKVGHTIMDSIEFLNRMIEDSNRFAVYMTSIQYGRSIDEAVNDAKDVTLNFNRKGTGEYGWQMIRNLYLFINPAVQSLQTLGALAKHHPFKFTAVTASWIASGVLVPIVNAALMQMAAAFLGGDGDDDKDWYKDISKKYWQFSKWDRRNNFIMLVPTTHEFVKIPLAQEFRAFYGLGDMIASKMMGGELAEESWEDYGWDLVGQVVDMLPLDPTGYDGELGVSLMPNPIRPVFELAFNVDFTGKPLFKDTEYNKYDPNFTKAYVGTPDWLVRASRMMNSIGNDYPDVQQNKWDALGNPRYNLNNPAVVDHVLSSYLGGAYTMGSQVLGLLTKSLNDPKEIKVADIPLFSKFVSNPDDRPVTKKQGDEFWDMKENHDRAANTMSKLKKQAKVDGDYSMLERFYGSEEYKQYKQDDVKVKKYEEDKKKERAEESGDEYRPHQLNAEDIYKNHATPMDEFEDMKLKQLFEKLNSFKTRYDAIVDNAQNESDGYYNTNKVAIDAIDEISLDKQEISELKKGFLDDGKDAYNAEDMKQIRELRKKILAVLEKANKVVVANQKAKAEK
jgi:site-specific DNA-cytosine methylase